MFVVGQRWARVQMYTALSMLLLRRNGLVLYFPDLVLVPPLDPYLFPFRICNMDNNEIGT